MKKMYICALIVCAAVSVSAQTIPFKTTACAENLLESYRRLSARKGLTSCFSKVYTITGYMQARLLFKSKRQWLCNFCQLF
jgi:hypothetical protein